MTQEEVAAKAGISREYVSFLETGQYKPSLEMLLKVCAAMGTKAWTIVKAVEEGKRSKK